MTRPNLLYVFADQLRLSSCGYAGDALARTPNIDAFAAGSLNFVNAVSGHPVCAPYRASLFTGKYTTSTGMVINEVRMNPNHDCFGHVLNAGGYETAYIGKWHLWANQLGNHDAHQNAYIPAGPYRLGFDGRWAAFNFHHEYVDAYCYMGDSDERVTLKGYEPDCQTDLAIQWMDELQDEGKPFAMFLSYGTPHDPWVPENVPPEYYAMFADTDFPVTPNYVDHDDPYGDNWSHLHEGQRTERINEMMKAYYAMTANLDWNFGRLMAALEARGLADNTIVIFTSDHGECFGAHGRMAKNTFYEEAVRVPFLMRSPANGVTAGVSDACLNTVDIMPTLLGMMDLPIPAKAEGMDLSGIATGQGGPEPEAALMMCTGPTADWEDGNEWRALRDKQYTYGVYRVDGSELLFDNLADPYQMTNLIDDPAHAATVERFRTMLAARMAEINDTFAPTSWYNGHWVDENRLIQRTATLNAKQ
jgi:arylsulfatase A-like enzyme